MVSVRCLVRSCTALRQIHAYDEAKVSYHSNAAKSVVVHTRLSFLSHAYCLTPLYSLCCRYELILQGSHDGNTWTEYDWRAKPGNPHRLPALYGPHIPMLCWRLWFLGNEHARGLAPPVWYDRLCVRLLQGDEAVEGLVRVPEEFSGAGNKPRYLKTLVYDYRFVHGHEADEAEKAEEERRRRARASSVKQEAKRLMEDDEEQDDENDEEEVEDEGDSKQWRLVQRREELRRRGHDASGVEDNKVRVNDTDFWYRLRYVGQYGGTYSLDTVERRLL